MAIPSLVQFDPLTSSVHFNVTLTKNNLAVFTARLFLVSETFFERQALKNLRTFKASNILRKKHVTRCSLKPELYRAGLI